MTPEVLLVTGLLLVTVVLLVTEKLPVDVTAIGVMVAVMALGLLSPEQTLAGLAHPAPVTVGALFIVTRGLTRTGALEHLTERFMDFAQGRSRRILALSLVLGGGLSALINNTPVVVLMIPLIIAVTSRGGLSPSKFLLPLSFISILAGTTTLIGTSTNIVVSDLAAQRGIPALGMFELTSVGLPLAVLGGVFLFLFSGRLLPAHRQMVLQTSAEQPRYISELLIPKDSTLIGQDPIDALCARCTGLMVSEVLRDARVLEPRQEEVRLQAGDIVLVQGLATELVRLLDGKLAALPKGEHGTLAEPFDDDNQIVELLVPPGSDLADQELQRVPMLWEAHVHVLGVKHRRHYFSAQKVSSLRLNIGDILLVQVPSDHLDALRADSNLIVLEESLPHLFHHRRAPVALITFVTMIALATTGVVPLLEASLAAAFVMLATGCLTPAAAYRAVDVKVLLLLVGSLALGAALRETGAADVYAGGLLTLFGQASPTLVLSMFILITSLLSLVLSNTATAALMVPVAFSMAASLGVEVRPFIVGLCFGASACFASPVGYQTNLLVFSPGGYKLRDYLRLGLPLQLMVWLGTSLLIPRVFSF